MAFDKTITRIVPFIGPKGVGKSNLFNVMSGKAAFSDDAVTTTPVQNRIKMAQGCVINYFDFSSDANVKAIQSKLNDNKTKVVCLVFDATDPHWITTLENYLTQTDISIPKSTSIVLVGNKYDLLNNDAQAQLEKSAIGYIRRHYSDRGEYIGVSAKTLGNKLTELEKGIINISLQERVGNDADSQSSDHASVNNLGNRPMLVVGDTPLKVKNVPQQNPVHIPNDTYLAATLRFAGLAFIVAALTTLIYVALIALGLVNATILTAAVTKIVTVVSGLLGLTNPVTIFTNVCAALGVSTTTTASVFAIGASFGMLGLGYTLKMLGHNQSRAANEEIISGPAISSTLRLLGIALMTAALINMLYLVLVGLHVFSGATLTLGTNKILGVVGGLLGMTAPVTTFTNLCALMGLNPTVVSGVFSASASVAIGRFGYSLFRNNPPALDHQVQYGIDNTPNRGGPSATLTAAGGRR